ncbi:hypothetical protein GPECTOR_2g962 [Gonium pectorale]|uniref:Phosphoglycerate kinase n=1 Tax=Gonium pectorale TaxID=33097 RepID=A0A150H3E5_GONPE|nr:hypothetical protein GPECTOR_2g962 [Gonium pectorale]|eukprot:KXZ56080.1 hypothetical protein GPECTOR_2g962 [Gonium pectorale]
MPLTRDCCTDENPCIPAGRYGVDIGPESSELFRRELLACRTIFWNGPMGKFEVPEFSRGTLAVAKALDEASRQGAVTIIGGGDSVAAVTAAGLAEHISHISTGGGASLELIEGRGMPGLRALLRPHAYGSAAAGADGPAAAAVKHAPAAEVPAAPPAEVPASPAPRDGGGSCCGPRKCCG